jgi:hypothetical protein
VEIREGLGIVPAENHDVILSGSEAGARNFTAAGIIVAVDENR